MRRFLLLSLLPLAACAQINTGGVGTLSTGEPISAELNLDDMSRRNSITLLSPSGWSCNGAFPTQQTVTRTVPLNCSNGATGQIILTANQIAGQVGGTFALTNGVSGQVTFGRT